MFVQQSKMRSINLYRALGNMYIIEHWCRVNLARRYFYDPKKKIKTVIYCRGIFFLGIIKANRQSTNYLRVNAFLKISQSCRI